MGEELRAGTIRAWGVSNYTAAQLAALLAAAADEGVPAPALCQPALSMLNTGALEELLPLCEKEGVGVVPYQLLQGGMLTGKYRRGQEAPAGSRLAEKPEWMKPFTDETYGGPGCGRGGRSRGRGCDDDTARAALGAGTARRGERSGGRQA